MHIQITIPQTVGRRKLKSGPFKATRFLFNCKQSSSTRKMQASKNHNINSGQNSPTMIQ